MSLKQRSQIYDLLLSTNKCREIAAKANFYSALGEPSTFSRGMKANVYSNTRLVQICDGLARETINKGTPQKKKKKNKRQKRQQSSRGWTKINTIQYNNILIFVCWFASF